MTRATLVIMTAALASAHCQLDSRNPAEAVSSMPGPEGADGLMPEVVERLSQAGAGGARGVPGPSEPSLPQGTGGTAPIGEPEVAQPAGPIAPACTSTCGDTCVALSADANHCGSCGHSCLGAACNAGVCEPATLVVGSYAALALSPGKLIVVDQTLGASLSSLTTESGPRFPFSAELSNPPYALSADDTFLYAAVFLRPGVSEVWRMPLSGGGPSSEEGGVLLGEVGSTVAFGSAGGSLISLEGRPTERTFNRRITRFDKGTPDSATVVATIDPVVSDAFAVDDNNAYVLEGIEADVQILSVPLDGSSTRSLAFQRAGESFTALAAAAGGVVFATTSRIGRVGSNALPETLTEGGAYHVLADADTAYYLAGDGPCTTGTDVHAIPLAGGAPVHLGHEPSPGCIQHVVADAGAIYFLTADGGQLRKLAKR